MYRGLKYSQSRKETGTVEARGKKVGVSTDGMGSKPGEAPQSAQ